MFAVAVCLLVATGVAEPLLTRSLSSGLIREHAIAQGVAGGEVVISSANSSVQQMLDTEAVVDRRVKAVVGPPTESMSTVIDPPAAGVLVRLQTTYNQCAHVRIIRGRCPQGRNEVIVSSKAAAVGGAAFTVGARLPAETTGGGAGPGMKMRIVGIFTSSGSDPFWAGTNVAAYVPPLPLPARPVPAEYWLTSDATFADGLDSGVHTSISYPVLTTHLTPQSLPAAVKGLAVSQRKFGAGVTVTEPLSAINSGTRRDVRQMGQILPFLLVQLGVVLLILLLQVTSFFATSRRPEAAVLKMRGNGTAGVLRFGAVEFLPAYTAGILGGIVVAYTVDALVRHLWLPGHVATQWVWSTVWIAAAMAVPVALVWVLCWSGMAREPISSLLRARRPRRRGVRLSMPTAVLGTLCVAGVVLTVTRNLTGAAVQVTPVLVAGLAAIVVGIVLTPIAGRWLRRQLAHRRASMALSVAQLGRRSGVVVAVTTLVISTALLTLSASIFARGADNRAARAAANLGTPAVISVTPGLIAVPPKAFVKAVESADPQHHYFSAAVGVGAISQGGTGVLGVRPTDLQRMGLRTGLRDQVPWSALHGADGSAPVTRALVATWTTRSAVGSTVDAPTMTEDDHPYRVTGAVPYIPGVGAHTIVVDLATLLKHGHRWDNVSYQVFSTTTDPRRVATLDRAIKKVGFSGIAVRSLHAVRSRYDATATGWATRLSILISALAVLAGAISVVLVAVASRDDRRRDLRALRTGGVPRTVLRRATVLEFVLLALVGSVAGAVTAPIAAWLAGPTMLWWSTPPAQPVTRTGFQWQVGGSSAIALIVLLAVIGGVFGVQLARSAEADTDQDGLR